MTKENTKEHLAYLSTNVFAEISNKLGLFVDLDKCKNIVIKINNTDYFLDKNKILEDFKKWLKENEDE